MESQTLSSAARTIIQQYLELPFVGKKVSTPYYNNRRKQVRGALRVLIGKGSPEDIYDEARLTALREKIDLESLTNEQIKQFLVDHNLGVDCSALVYHVLQAELIAQGKKSLKSVLLFPRTGFLRWYLTHLRPVENTNVTVLADEKNTHVVTLDQVCPGDLLVMEKTGAHHDRDHICIIHQVDREKNTPARIHYTHSFEWSTDGKYNHGVRQGYIDILDTTKNLLDQRWLEQGRENSHNETLNHASQAEIFSLRRLNGLA